MPPTDPASRYDYAFDPGDDSTAARVCRLVGHDRDVLELGCAAGVMSAVLSGHYGCRVTGVEYDAASAVQARYYCQQVVQADLDDADWAGALTRDSYDTVVAADVLEHLHDPLACLRRVRTLLTGDGQLVVSVPNIAHSGALAALLCNDFPYRDTGLLDRTHIHFFTARTLGQMLVEAGFTVDTVDTVDAGPWHPEFSRYWSALPPAVREWLAQNPSGRAYQIIMHARPALAPPAYDDSEHTAATQQWLATLPHDVQTGQHDAQTAVQHDTAAAAPLTAMQNEHAALVAALAEVQQERDQSNAALAAIRSSRTWRLTAPLRQLARTLKSWV